MVFSSFSALLWCPLVEAAVMEIDRRLFIDLRYANYVVFTLAPRCLSSLVYGLRDQKIFVNLKYYAVFGLACQPPVLND